MNLVQISNNLSSDVGIDKGFGKLEMFSEDVESPVTTDKADKGDCAIRNVIDFGQSKFGGWQDRSKVSFLGHLQRGFAFEAAISVISIVEEFKVFRLWFKMAIVTKPLSSEELPIVGVIKALDSTITPRFSDRNKNHLYTQGEAEFDNNPKRTRVPVASSEAEFVV